MTDRFQDQVAIVTGGASGIGLETARRLLTDGANVLLADINETNANQAKAALQAQGFADQVDICLADVCKEDDVANLYQIAIKRWGRVDIACLNAGIGGAFGPINKTSVEHWDETFAMLARSVFLGIKFAVDPMSERGGSIVATSSVAGLSGGAAGHSYSAAKAAVVSIAKTAAIELADRRIRVNTVAPGLISTPLAHRGDESSITRFLEHQPWPEAGQPTDIAATIAFLASSDAAFITGATIVADGGMTAEGAHIWGNDWLFSDKRSGMNRGSTGREPTLNDHSDQ